MISGGIEPTTTAALISGGASILGPVLGGAMGKGGGKTPEPKSSMPAAQSPSLTPSKAPQSLQFQKPAVTPRPSLALEQLKKEV